MWALFYLFTPCKLHLVLQLKLRWLIRREELQRKRTNTAIFSVALQLVNIVIRKSINTIISDYNVITISFKQAHVLQARKHLCQNQNAVLGIGHTRHLPRRVGDQRRAFRINKN